MATVTDVEVANASFPNVRQDLNDILEALASNFSNDTEPTTMYPSQFWYENDTNLLYLRNEDNDAWITLAFFDQTNDEWEVRTGVVQAANGDGLALKTDEGTTRVSIADDGSVTINTSLDVDNIKIDGNSITSTDTNGDINITPNGTGKVVLDGLNYPTADGTDGQVLTTDGSGNIAFEDAGGAGKVLQVVYGSTSTRVNSATNVDQSTGLSASITPSSASSKVLVLVNQVGCRTDGTERRLDLKLKRNSTFLLNFARNAAFNTNGGSVNVGSCSTSFLDSPNTTSSVTYQTDFMSDDNNGTVTVQDDGAGSEATSTIVLMEIAG